MQWFFYVHPRFYPTLVGWDLELPWKLPIPGTITRRRNDVGTTIAVETGGYIHPCRHVGFLFSINQANLI